MTIPLIICASLLGIAAAGSGLAKLRGAPLVMQTMQRVGLRPGQVKVLAVLELLGALGLLVSIWVPILGILAAAGLTLYFLGAVIAHLRVKDPFAAALPPIVLALLALVTTLLEITR